jgi:hypothetical protein
MGFIQQKATKRVYFNIRVEEEGFSTYPYSNQLHFGPLYASEPFYDIHG